DGAPLHLGHERRLHNKHQRIAIELRDGPTCALDGCDIPAAWCHAHHVVPWSQGGQTTLDDGILICPHHHNLAHHPNWQLTRQDGVWRLRKANPPDVARKQRSRGDEPIQ
ncbi:MAG TPA: HNH endonuclease signature motif containing protein, partial [Nocardioidaceae bacterium]|nr:HNH endonuclease signature motif containing protein [Nocardioidaceae bacterium]